MSALSPKVAHKAPVHTAEPFDPEPASTLGPDEPPTPLWLAAIGASVLLMAVIYLLVLTGGNPAPSAPSAAPISTETTTQSFVPLPKARALGPGSSSAPLDDPPRKPRLTPEQIQEIKRRLDQRRTDQAP
jgi:hypothetical protein